MVFAVRDGAGDEERGSSFKKLFRQGLRKDLEIGVVLFPILQALILGLYVQTEI
jgi:hypothetical protein